MSAFTYKFRGLKGPNIQCHDWYSSILLIRSLNKEHTDSVPQNLKLADITPVFKKENPLHKVNYRPVSVLTNISKVFKKLMQKQTSCYISNYLSPYFCEYRKGFNSQRALLSLIENWKKFLDKKGFGGAVLMDLGLLIQ